MLKTKLSKVASILLCSTLFIGTYSQANTNSNVTTETKASLGSIDTEKLSELLKLLQEANKGLSGTSLSFIKDLGGVFDTINGIIKSVASGKLDFDIKTISTRIKLSIKLVQNIKVAADALTNKEQHVLTKFGFSISGIIIDTLNPLTSNMVLNYDLTKLDKVLKEALEGPVQGPDSIANTNKKEELARLLRSSRSLILENILHIKNNETFDNFKNEVSKATLVRLDPNKKVREVNETIEKITTLKENLIEVIANLSDESIIATLAQKEELAEKLRYARTLKYTQLRGKSLEIRRNLDKTILKLTGVRLDIDATVAEINNAKEDLKEAIEEATSAKDVMASNELRQELLAKLHEARFLKFNVLSKKGWDVNYTVDKVIFSLNGLSINLYSTQVEVENALEKLNNAIEKAKAAPNKW